MLTIVVDGDALVLDAAAAVLLEGCWVVDTCVVDVCATGATATAIWSPVKSSNGVEYPVDGTCPMTTSPVKVAFRASAFARFPGV